MKLIHKEAKTNTVPEDIARMQHQTAPLTGLLMSTNKASCRNTTSHLWLLELLSNSVFSNTFAPWEFAFYPSRRRDGERERKELGSSERVKYELRIFCSALQQGVFTIRPVSVDVPYLFEHNMVVHSHTVLRALQASVRLRLRQLPYIQFASRFGFTPLILSEGAGEEMGGGGFAWGGRGGKVGQRTRTEARTAAPSAPPSSSWMVRVAPPPLSEVWRWQLVRDLWAACTLARALLYPYAKKSF